MNPKDLLLQVGSVTAAAAALLTAQPGQAAVPRHLYDAAGAAAERKERDDAAEVRKLVLTPDTHQSVLLAKGHRSHGSHRSHASHVSGSGRGYSLGRSGGYGGGYGGFSGGSAGGYFGGYGSYGGYSDPYGDDEETGGYGYSGGYSINQPSFGNGIFNIAPNAPRIKDPALSRVWTHADPAEPELPPAAAMPDPVAPTPRTLNLFERFTQAVRNSSEETARALLAEHPELLVAQGPEGRTVLHVAAQYARVPIVKLLLDAGADPNAQSWLRAMPIDVVPMPGGPDTPPVRTLELLLQRKARAEGGTAVPPLVRCILAMNPNTSTTDESTTAEGEGVKQVAQLLIAAGADPNLRDDQGYTLFLTALRRGHCSLARLLLRLGSDPKAVTRKGETAFHLLGERVGTPGAMVIVDVLVKAGCDLNTPDAEGKTAYERANLARNTAFAEFLAKRGARKTPVK